ILALVAVSLLAASGFWAISRSIRDVTESPRPLKRRLLVAGFAAIGLWLMIAGLLVVPIANLISKAGFVVIRDGSGRIASWSAAKCVAEIIGAPGHFSREIGGTLITAVCAATLAVCVAVLLAWLARRGGSLAIPALATAIVAIAVPGPLVGIALIGAF